MDACAIYAVDLRQRGTDPMSRECLYPLACYYPDECGCVIAEAPSIVPLTVNQQRFMWLHARRSDYVAKWHWLLGGAQFRAYTERGYTATIGRVDLDDLIARGLMQRKHGDQVELTSAGWTLSALV
jgi:hypothetical protein